MKNLIINNNNNNSFCHWKHNYLCKSDANILAFQNQAQDRSEHNFGDNNAGIAGQSNMSEWNTEDTAGDREKSEDCIDYDIRLRHGVPVIVRVHHITDLYNWTPCVSVSVVGSVKGRPVIFSGGLAARRMNDDKCPAFIIRNYAGTQVTSSSWSAHY